MANPEHLKILKQGVQAWNSWRQSELAVRPDLAYQNLDGADLIRFNLEDATFRDSRLREAFLSTLR